jgi:hypothetical protein
MYKVTIEEIVEWEVPETMYVKVADSGNERDGGNVYDYRPTGETVMRSRKETTYEQVVNDIDLKIVIAAVNGMAYAK